MSAPKEIAVLGGVVLIDALTLGRGRPATIAGKTFYRSMSKAEAVAVKETGKLRGGRPDVTYFTDSRFKTADRAKDRLSLPSKPEVQMEFTIKNDVKLDKSGTKVAPDYGSNGRGKEYSTYDPVEVDVINVQPY